MKLFWILENINLFDMLECLVSCRCHWSCWGQSLLRSEDGVFHHERSKVRLSFIFSVNYILYYKFWSMLIYQLLKFFGVINTVKSICSHDEISCTLWDQLAVKFSTYWNQRTVQDTVVVIIRHARIKEPRGKYAMSLSNAWNGTQLIINEDIPEITNFKSRFVYYAYHLSYFHIY